MMSDLSRLIRPPPPPWPSSAAAQTTVGRTASMAAPRMAGIHVHLRWGMRISGLARSGTRFVKSITRRPAKSTAAGRARRAPDNSPSQHAIALIPHHGLARRDGALGFGEHDLGSVALDHPDGGERRFVIVADLGPDGDARLGRGAGDEVDAPGEEGRALHARRGANAHRSRIGIEVGDVEEVAGGESQTLALPDREVGDAGVGADHTPLVVDNGTGLEDIGPRAAEESTVIAVGDEAELLALRSLGRG